MFNRINTDRTTCYANALTGVPPLVSGVCTVPPCRPVPAGEGDGDQAGPDVLEDGDGLAVGQALQRHPVHGEDLVTCTHQRHLGDNVSSSVTLRSFERKVLGLLVFNPNPDGWGCI